MKDCGFRCRYISFPASLTFNDYIDILLTISLNMDSFIDAFRVFPADWTHQELGPPYLLLFSFLSLPLGKDRELGLGGWWSEYRLRNLLLSRNWNVLLIIPIFLFPTHFLNYVVLKCQLPITYNTFRSSYDLICWKYFEVSANRNISDWTASRSPQDEVPTWHANTINHIVERQLCRFSFPYQTYQCQKWPVHMVKTT